MRKIIEILSELHIQSRSIVGNCNQSFDYPSAISNAEKGSITFCDNKNSKLLDNTKASVVLLSIETYKLLESLSPNTTYVIVDNPKLCFLKILQYCFPVKQEKAIDKTAKIYPWVRIGENIVIKEFCVVGSEGLGHIQDEKGNLVNFPSYGNVILEDNVELYPYTTVDRGVLGNTVIGKGTKISHYCYISHNCIIGKNCIITPGVILCGGVKLGDGVFIGAGALIRNNVVVHDNAIIGIGSVVIKDVNKGETVYGNPAKPKKVRKDKE